MPLIIDRYVLKLFIAYLLAGLVVFVTLFLSVDALSMMMRFPNVEGAIIFRYYGYMVPEVINQLFPVACLLGALFVLSTLNRGGELIALFASGMSLFRISLPMIYTVIILSGGFAVLGDKLLPRFAQKKNFTYYHEIKKKPSQYSTVKTDRIWYRSKDSIFNIKTVNEKTKSAQGLTLYTFNDSWDLVQMLTADSVEFKGRQWKLKKGSVTVFSGESSFPLTSDFRDKVIVMGEDADDIQSTAHSTDVLSVAELKHYIQRNKEAGLDTTSFEVGYYAKFAFPFTALIMALLALPFGVSRARSGGAMMNIGISLFMVFVYWTLYNSLLTLGYHGQLHPILSAWGGNIIIGSVAFWLIVKMKK